MMHGNVVGTVVDEIYKTVCIMMNKKHKWININF